MASVAPASKLQISNIRKGDGVAGTRERKMMKRVLFIYNFTFPSLKKLRENCSDELFSLAIKRTTLLAPIGSLFLSVFWRNASFRNIFVFFFFVVVILLNVPPPHLFGSRCILRQKSSPRISRRLKQLGKFLLFYFLSFFFLSRGSVIL